MGEKRIKWLITVVVVLLAGVITALCVAQYRTEQKKAASTTAAPETFAPVTDGDAAVSVRQNLSRADLSGEADDWLTGCSDSTRDDFFDVHMLTHVLTHEDKGEGAVTVTCLLYRAIREEMPEAVQARAEVVKNSEGTYEIHVAYEPVTEGKESFDLTAVTVTLPAGAVWEIRAFDGDERDASLSSIVTSAGAAIEIKP